MQTQLATYLYIIDLDERGAFRAHVEHAQTGEVVYNIYGGDELEPDETNIVDDGYMRNYNDIDGLTNYLKMAGIMSANDTLTKQ